MVPKASVSAKQPEPENAEIAQRWPEWLLIGVAVLTMAGVAIWFELDVNRVFDVPKASALKIGGSFLLLFGLGYGLFGGGWAYGSLRLFLAPVFTLAGAVGISSLLSIDLPTSLFGVYERQFGLQGFLGCIGLYFGTAVAFRSRRGAVLGLICLALVAGLVGSYAYLQSTGQDPYPFFAGKPNDKVYSFLGNATFAGNALALAFPISAVLAVWSVRRTTSRENGVGWLPVALGAAIFLGLQVGIGYAVGGPGSGSSERPAALYKFGAGLSLLFALSVGAVGTYGPSALRLAGERARRFADAMGAGALLGAAWGIAIGLICTHTRGAWVGTLAAFGMALLLYPFFYRDEPAKKKKLLLINAAALVAIAIFGSLWITQPEGVCGGNARCLKYAKTLRSIPLAFDTGKYQGKGQGTRPFLWKESPLVLTEHALTLERLYDDRIDYANGIAKGEIEGLSFAKKTPRDEGQRSFDTAWRTKLVYLFGIGIETYRFAFMSHKSKGLEMRDPMTNHDNPHNNYLYVLASFGVVGLAAYLWLLFRFLRESLQRFLGTKGGATLDERVLGFGAVLSFFSYSFYSIGGFDSVACSVFLFYLLGTISAFFEPTVREPPAPLGRALAAHWAKFRGRETASEGPGPGLRAALFLPLALLLLYGIRTGFVVYWAEQAFVGVDAGARTRTAYIDAKLSGIKAAIKLHPYESYYKQNLGNTYADAARYLRGEATQEARAGKNERARDLAQQAATYEQKAEIALYAALDHAWAPENVFISLFQLQYGARRYEDAERSLERALVHSPHLGAVRANLAVLKLERGAAKEALADAQWVIEVDTRNPVALRTAGRASQLLGELKRARVYLERAQKLSPKDPATQRYLDELTEAERAKTSTGAG